MVVLLQVADGIHTIASSADGRNGVVALAVEVVKVKNDGSGELGSGWRTAWGQVGKCGTYEDGKRYCAHVESTCHGRELKRE
jgi:hypothetical protein